MADSQCTEDSTSGSNQVCIHMQINNKDLGATGLGKQKGCQEKEKEGWQWSLCYDQTDAAEA